MKKLFGVLALAVAGTACQPTTRTNDTTTTVLPAATTKVPIAKSAELSLPVLFSAADTLSKSMRDLLGEYDLSELWRGDNKQRRRTPALEGFFGPDHYRFTMVVTEAQCEAQNPAVYHVRGKCRYHKNIRAFAGTLTILQVSDLESYYSPQDNTFIPVRSDSMSGEAWQAAYEKAVSQTSCYSLRAQLQVQETAAENSGVFEGEAILNFFVAPPHLVGYAGAPALTEGEPARGSSLLLHGARRNRTTRQIKQFEVADDVFAAAPDVYKDFVIGERDSDFNPKYAKLGWNTYWENDEWWADTPKPSLNL